MQVDPINSKNLHLCVIFSKTVSEKPEFHSFCTPSFFKKPDFAQGHFKTETWQEFATTYNVTVCSINSVFLNIFSFLENWDTQPLTQLEVMQERRLYDCFFMSQYNPSFEVKHITWIRKNNPATYSLIVKSNSLNKIQQIYFQHMTWGIKPHSVDKVFDKEVFQLNNQQLEIKNEATLNCKTNYIGQIVETHKFSADTSALCLFILFQKMKDKTLPHPLTIKRFLLTPSIKEIDRLIISPEGVETLQTIS